MRPGQFPPRNQGPAVHALIASLLALVLAVFSVGTSGAADGSLPKNVVDENGNITMPDDDFRRVWTALGAWATAADEGVRGSKGFHMVYTQPEVVEAFRKTGKFPDGAVIVKELMGAKTDEFTTGTHSFASGISGWFVMVKDSTGRFEGKNKLWGKGWGWAYFDAKDRKNTTTKDFAEECLTCHIPAENTDWIYTQAYPVLEK